MKAKNFIFTVLCVILTSCGNESKYEYTQLNKEKSLEIIEKNAKFFQGEKQIEVDTLQVLIIKPVNCEEKKGLAPNSYVVYTGKCILLNNGCIIKDWMLSTEELESVNEWPFVSEGDELIVTKSGVLVKNITLLNKII